MVNKEAHVLLVVCMISVVFGDLLSSLENLQTVVTSEAEISKEIRKQVEEQEQKLQQWKRISASYEQYVKSAESKFDNPVELFLVTKQLTVDLERDVKPLFSNSFQGFVWKIKALKAKARSAVGDLNEVISRYRDAISISGPNKALQKQGISELLDEVLSMKNDHRHNHKSTRDQPDGLSSADNMKSVLQTEAEIAKEIRNHVEEGEKRLAEWNRLIANYEGRTKPEINRNNPVDMFLFAKQYTKDWDERLEQTLDGSFVRNFISNVQTLRQKMFPAIDKLSKVVLNAASNYQKKDTTDTEEENIGGHSLRGLSAEDSAELGRQAYDDQDYDNVILWMETAMLKSKQGRDPSVDRVEILDHLAFSYYQKGYIKKALTLTNDLLSLDPSHDRAVANKQLFEKMVKENMENVKDTTALWDNAAPSFCKTDAECFTRGKLAYEDENFHVALVFLEKAKVLRKNNEISVNLMELLDYMAFALYKTGNVTGALSVTNALLDLDPTHSRATKNRRLYEEMLMADPDQVDAIGPITEEKCKTAEECFKLGKIALFNNEYHKVLMRMDEAMAKSLKSKTSSVDLKDVYNYMQYAAYKEGNTERALSLTNRILTIDATDDKALTNKRIYEKITQTHTERGNKINDEETTRKTFETDTQATANKVGLESSFKRGEEYDFIDTEEAEADDEEEVLKEDSSFQFCYSVEDCFEEGKDAYHEEDYPSALFWMGEALARNSENEISSVDLKEMLGYMQHCAYKVGNIAQALVLTSKVLLLDPTHTLASERKQFYEDILETSSKQWGMSDEEDATPEDVKYALCNTVEECFQEGVIAYDDEDYPAALLWMDEALARFRLGKTTAIDRKELLDRTQDAAYMVGNIARALSLTNELLLLDPTNRRAVEDKRFYEKLMQKGTNMLEKYSVKESDTKGETIPPTCDTAEDCFERGKRAYNDEDYSAVLLWMDQAIAKSSRETTTSANRVEVLDYMQFAAYKLGNIQRALSLTKEIIKLDSNHPYAQSNARSYEDMLQRERSQLEEPNLIEDVEQHDNTDEICDTAEDCFELGVLAYNDEDYNSTLRWMGKAMLKNKMDKENFVDEKLILDYMAFSLFKEGNITGALALTYQLLELDPSHSRAQDNKKRLEDMIEGKEVTKSSKGLQTELRNFEKENLKGDSGRPKRLRCDTVDDCFALGEISYANRDYYNANLLMKKAMDLDQSDLEMSDEAKSVEWRTKTLQVMSSCAYQLRNVRQALNLTNELLALDPNNKEAKESLMFYEAVLSDTPSDTEDTQKVHDECDTDVGDSVVVSSRNQFVQTASCFRLGKLEYNKTNYYNSLLLMEKALVLAMDRKQTSVNRVSLFFVMAGASYKQGDISDALFWIDEVLSRAPNHSNAIENKRYLQFLMYEFDNQLDNLSIAVNESAKDSVSEFKCDSVVGCFELGRLAYNDTDYAKALRLMEEAMDKLKKTVTIRSNFTRKIVMEHIAFYSYQQGDAHRAFELANELRTLYPNDSKTFYNQRYYSDMVQRIKGEVENSSRTINIAADLSTSCENAEDCFNIGKFAYSKNDYEGTLVWMEKAIVKMFNNRTSVDLQQLLENMQFSYYQIGNLERALSLSEELLVLNPNHPYAAENVRDYVDVLENRLFTETKEFAKYEALCNGDVIQLYKHRHRLVCRYRSNGDPLLLLQPVKEEEVYLDPWIVIFHDILNEREIKRLKTLAKYELEDSRVLGKGAYKSISRISKTGWITEKGATIHKINQRFAAIAGFDLSTAEMLQVAFYKKGGKFEPHTDHAKKADMNDTEIFGGGGNRIATLLTYLKDTSCGGATVFPNLGIRYAPKKGSALFWYNLYKNGTGIDAGTVHAGCPLLSGTKWICTKWFHEYGQEFRRPCALNQYE